MSSDSLILSIDFGSTNACARLYNNKLCSLAEVNRPTATLDPEVCWQIICDLITNVLEAADVPPSAVGYFGIAVQRNSFLLWDRQTSVPLTKLSTWQDNSGVAFTASVNRSNIIRTVKGCAGALYKICPIVKLKVISNLNFVDILVCSRLAHIFHENPELSRRCRRGEIRFGCLDTWLLWKLTGGKSWCADVSCSSAWGTFDPCIMRSNPFILKYFSLSSKMFPPICPTSANYGRIRCGPLARTDDELANGVPMVRVTALIGDSQAAMLGAGCLNNGDTKISLGTGAFFNMNVGSKPVGINKGFYPVIGWAKSVRDPTEETSCEEDPDTNLQDATHLIEGFNSEAGIAVTKLMKMGIFREYCELAQMLTEVSASKDYESVFYVPSCLGVRTDIKRKKMVEMVGSEKLLFFANTSTTLTDGGVFVGLPKSDSNTSAVDRLPRHLRAIIMFAVFDSIAMAARLQCAIGLDSNFASKITVLNVTGNLSKSNWLMQRLADTIGVPVKRSHLSETCCLGAAIAAGVGAGIWEDYADAIPFSLKQTKRACRASINNENSFQCQFSPDPKVVTAQAFRYQKWLQTCQTILGSGKTYQYTKDVNGCVSPSRPISLNGLYNCLH